MERINKIKLLAKGENLERAIILIKQGILPFEIICTLDEFSKSDLNKNKFIRLYDVKNFSVNDFDLYIMSLNLSKIFKNAEKSYNEWIITDYIKANETSYKVLQSENNSETNNTTLTIKDDENNLELVNINEVKSAIEDVIFEQIKSEHPKYVNK